MTYDITYCEDYERDICPKTCYRAEITQKLRDEAIKDSFDPKTFAMLSYAHFKNGPYCPMEEEHD